MNRERNEELRREERVILAWIRDVTAKKQERLMEIRAELNGTCGAAPSKAGKSISRVAR